MFEQVLPLTILHSTAADENADVKALEREVAQLRSEKAEHLAGKVSGEQIDLIYSLKPCNRCPNH